MTSVEGSPAGGTFIPHERFIAITFGLVFGTLIFGILLPNGQHIHIQNCCSSLHIHILQTFLHFSIAVEFVMALVGATMGTVLTYILPSYIFLRVAGKDTLKTEAKVVLSVLIEAQYPSLYNYHHQN